MVGAGNFTQLHKNLLGFGNVLCNAKGKALFFKFQLSLFLRHVAKDNPVSFTELPNCEATFAFVILVEI